MTRLNGGAALLAVAVFLIVAALSACAPGQVKQTLQVASDANLVEECADFLQAEQRLRAKIMVMSENDLRRLAEIDIAGTALCTQEISELTAELRAIEGRLP